jgi:hypothetical protein
MKCIKFLFKRSEFHKGLVEDAMEELKKQGENFEAFGGFISEMGNKIEAKPTKPQSSIDKLFRKMVSCK